MSLNDLISDALIRARTFGGQILDLSLPELLAALSDPDDDVADFPRLQPHQTHPWHAFLVQLAAIALDADHLAPEDMPGADWATLLRALAPDEAWRLVVDDLSKAAFMQPAVLDGPAEPPEVLSPDLLDVLQSARNHDVKRRRMVHPEPEHWLHALIGVQTMQGYSGKMWYGIARMNGGLGNRPGVAVASSLRLGPRFRRDVAVLLEHRADITRMSGYQDHGGQALLWLQPWDGKTPIALAECDPYFIEVCRRVRLRRLVSTGAIAAWTRNSTAKRVDAPDALKGITGDPWTPVELGDASKAMTLSGSGFTYEKTRQLIMQEISAAPAQKLRTSDPLRMLWVAWALVRGQGKTEGLHERVVCLPGPVRKTLAVAAERDRLSKLAKDRVTTAGDVWSRGLSPALAALASGGEPQKLERGCRGAHAGPWRSRFDEAVDRVFFERLWEAVELPEEQADRAWKEELLEQAARLLDEASTAAAGPEARRLKGRAVAEMIILAIRARMLPKDDDIVLARAAESGDPLAPTTQEELHV